MADHYLDVLEGNMEEAKSPVVKDYSQPSQKHQGPKVQNLLQLCTRLRGTKGDKIHRVLQITKTSPMKG